MLPYAAYLRVYEPLTAFPEPERSHWADYAAPGAGAEPAESAEPAEAWPGKPAVPPGQHVQCHGHLNVLEAEHAEALRRIIAVPPIVAPRHESGHAYVRQADGQVYICPWQTRLRSWLALGRLRATLTPPLADTFVPRHVADLAAADFARWHARSPSIRTHILTATWHVPTAWFVPFGPPERWLVLGAAGGTGQPLQPARAAPARALIYTTTMSQARKRVARAINAVGRRGGSDPHSRGNMRVSGGSGARRDAGTGRGRHEAEPLSARLSSAAAEIEEVGRWLAEFRPGALVELDYGGLVYLLDDEALRCDQSVAEVGAAVTGLENGEFELALAMYQRLRARWRPMQATESAS